MQNIKLAKITKKDLEFLIDINVIKFSNDGLKEVITKLFEMIENKSVDKFLTDNKITEEDIEFQSFEKLSVENNDYALMNDEEKIEYQKFWLNRLAFFANIDYLWDKETFEAQRVLLLENSKISENSNIEILGMAYNNDLLLDKEILEKTPLLIENEKEVDLDNLEKFNNVKYKIPTENLSLISVERDKNFYVKSITEISDLLTLISILDDLNKMNDNTFIEILLLSSCCSEEDLMKTPPLKIFLDKVIELNNKNNWISFVSGDSNIYSRVLGFEIGHRVSLTNEMLDVIHNFNIKINTIVFNEFNRTKERRLEQFIGDAISVFMEKMVILPQMTMKIDPVIVNKLTNSNIIKKMKRLNYVVEDNIVTINTKDKFNDFKDLTKKTLKNLSSNYVFDRLNQLKDDFTYSSMSITKTHIAFGLYKLFNEYNKVSQKTKNIYDKLVFALIEHTNTGYEQDTFNHFILAEKITEFETLTLRDKLITLSVRPTKFLEKLLHEDLKMKIKVKESNINIDYFYEEKESRTTKTKLKMREIIEVLTQESNFFVEDFIRVLGVDEEKAKEYKKDFYANILDQTDIFEYLEFGRPEEVLNYYHFKDTIISKISDYKVRDIDSNVIAAILSCFLNNNLSEDYIVKFIKENDKHKRELEKISFKDCFDYFAKNQKIKAKDLDKYSYDSHAFYDTDKDKVDRLSEIIKLNNNPIFKLIKEKYVERVEKWVCALYNNEKWVEEEDSKTKDYLVTNLINNKLIYGNVIGLIINKENNKNIKEKCFEILFKDFCRNEELILKILEKDNSVNFSNETNERMFLKHLIENVSFIKASSLNNLLSIMKNKEDVFIEFFMAFNKSGQMSFELKNLSTEIFNRNNKRLFKKIISAMSSNMEQSHNIEDKDKEDYIFAMIERSVIVSDFFNKSFKEDSLFIDLIVNLSKITQEEFNKQGKVNEELKKEILKTYVMLPSNLSKIAVDKLNEGKLLHVVVSEINLMEKIKDEPSTIQRKKKKI